MKPRSPPCSRLGPAEYAPRGVFKRELARDDLLAELGRFGEQLLDCFLIAAQRGPQQDMAHTNFGPVEIGMVGIEKRLIGRVAHFALHEPFPERLPSQPGAKLAFGLPLLGQETLEGYLLLVKLHPDLLFGQPDLGIGDRGAGALHQLLDQQPVDELREHFGTERGRALGIDLTTGQHAPHAALDLAPLDRLAVDDRRRALGAARVGGRCLALARAARGKRRGRRKRDRESDTCPQICPAGAATSHRALNAGAVPHALHSHIRFR